jgi:hypothetical protein
MGRGIAGTTATLFIAFALVSTSVAAAEGPTRDEYRDTVEPICKTNTKANERILSGVRGQVRENKLKAAGAKFAKASAALKKARRQLLGVKQPSADAQRLKRWLDYVKTEADLFGQTAKKLKAEDRGAANQLVIKLTQTANRANAQVLPFDFVYCRLEPARFT